MSLLVESIKVKSGVLYNIQLHNERFNKTRKDLFGINKSVDLRDFVEVPQTDNEIIYKLRILYGHEIEKIEFIPYQIRKVETIKLVHSDDIEYQYKYADRSKLDKLLEQKDNCDDILIIKNGFVTDTSYSNIVFYDNSQWFVPETYLLNGTKRQFLLNNNTIKQISIKIEDLKNFSYARLINAMLDFDKTDYTKWMF